jgi:hypothetical protein
MSLRYVCRSYPRLLESRHVDTQALGTSPSDVGRPFRLRFPARRGFSSDRYLRYSPFKTLQIRRYERKCYGYVVSLRLQISRHVI